MRYLILLFCPAIALADPPEIVGIEATPQSGTWRFSVTLLHGDTGWDDYADGWRVETGDGSVLGTRELLHPHVNEQPFTRSHSITIPEGTAQVFVRAKDSVGGWADNRATFDLPQGS